MKEEYASKGPELLIDLADMTFDVLKDHVGEELGRSISLKLVDKMRHHWGGQIVYFPKGQSLDALARDIKMYAEFNGSNHAALARRYDLSLQQVYGRIRFIRESRFAEQQGDMFED